MLSYISNYHHQTHLHGLEDIIISHPGARLASPLLSWLRPDLVKAWHDEGSPVDGDGQDGQDGQMNQDGYPQSMMVGKNDKG